MNASSSSTGIRCSECSMSFSSAKSLFGHLRIHRNRNIGAGKTSILRWRGTKYSEDVIAASILMGISRSKSETEIEDAKLSQLRWVCAKIERQRKRMEEFNSFQCKESKSNEEGKADAVVSLEVEMHQCDKCDKVFNSGQALGGHKRAHYAGPPLCRPGSNGSSPAAVVEVEVVVRDFDLNEAAEEVFL